MAAVRVPLGSLPNVPRGREEGRGGWKGEEGEGRGEKKENTP